MKENLTDITLLLDRTGSMQSIRSDVVGGINTFIEEQKNIEGEANFTLVQFDSQNPHEVIHNAVPIKDVPNLTNDQYQPRSMTPLLDAMGMLIVTTGERLETTPEESRPSKVVFVVFTDGYENASKEYSSKEIMDKVNHQRETYGWQFIFLGADIDAFSQGGAVGMQCLTTANISKKNILRAFKISSHNLAEYRGSGSLPSSLHYSEEQREQLK